MESLDRPGLKSALKALRGSQPFNHVATSLAKALLGASGKESEFLVKHLHRVGSVRTRLPNGKTLRLWSRGDDWISNLIFWKGWDGYEPETTRIFFKLAQRARGVFDVGSYVGFYTLMAALANPQGWTYAFEPLPVVYGRLEQNVSLNRLTNVTCRRAAIGDFDGSADFYHVASGLPSSSSLSPQFMRGTPGLRNSQVPVIRLDDFVQRNRVGCVDLVKIDTEGTESQVLSGMMATLRRDRPAIVCEIVGRGGEEQVEAILKPLGYRFYLLTEAGPVRKPEINGVLGTPNYLFTTRDPEEILGR